MRNRKLNNVCLCAIVKNEKMNPAGGIVDYIESIVPYVGSAVIVDTGSNDGTREILDKSEIKYSNLKVFDREFRGFSDARNYSVEMGFLSKKKYALFLDADERFFKNDFVNMFDFIKSNPAASYHFRFQNISFDDGSNVAVPCWSRRMLMFRGEIEFHGNVFENIQYRIMPNKFFSSFSEYMPVAIKHFLPSNDSLKEKGVWYDNLIKFFNGERGRPVDNFDSWKTKNPHRNNFV